LKNGKLDFSVIVPTRNRPAALARCLESLRALDFPTHAFEVIVVDDGSETAYPEIVTAFDHAFDVTYLTIGHSGPATARNAGVAVSTGRRLAFIDDDCAAEPAWLSALSDSLDAEPDSVVGGKVINALTGNRYSRASQNLQRFLYSWYHEERRGLLRFFTSNNLAANRSTFDRVGGFNESFAFASEDREWCDRALAAGHELTYSPTAVVQHAHDLTLGSFLHQHFRYGQGASQFHAARAARGGGRIHVEPPGFYGGMFAAPFATGEPGALVQAALLFASQSALAAGFAQKQLRQLGASRPVAPQNVAPGFATERASAQHIPGNREEMHWNRY
jgi:glycosyltransferase involved in cell wall biosynthesis